MKLKQYQKYKDSGVLWIGDVPNSWELMRFKFTVRICNGQDYKDVEDEEGKYPILGTGGEFGRSVKYLYNKPSVLLGRKGTIDKPQYTEKPFWTVDTLFYTEIGKRMVPKFVYYFSIIFPFEKYSDTTTVPSMTQEKLNQIEITIPPKPEQLHMVKYLDKEITKIDQTIETLRKLKEILKEKRLCLVGQAILDDKLPRTRIQHLVENISSPIHRKEKEVYTPLGLYNWARGIFHKSQTAGEELGDSSFYYVKEGDLILSGQFAWEGAVAIAGPKEEGCVVSHRFPILRGKKEKIRTEYLWAFFTSKEGDFILNECSIGSAGRNRPLNINRLMKQKITVPSFELQERVVRIIEKEKKLEKLDKKFTRLMEEYKKSLIHHIVTGKVDVRGIES
jgi:type I restriction enzyme, S subunit